MDTPRKALAQQIEDSGIVAILRTLDPAGLVEACAAMADGGLAVAEVPLTTPNALDLVTTIADQLADRLIIGTGSVLDAEGVQRSADAGARFIVSPILKREVIDAAHAKSLPCMPGALTPTEIQQAHEWGADLIKVFPGDAFGGPGYIKGLLAPLPHLKLMPTGGVTLETAADWITAGAVSLGVGTHIFRPDLIAQKDFRGLTESTRRWVQVVRQAKQA